MDFPTLKVLENMKHTCMFIMFYVCVCVISVMSQKHVIIEVINYIQ